jgi:epoxide hydrolase-like predicted phosphatase
MSGNIKALVFDIGGVVCQESRRQQYEELAQSFDYDLEHFYQVRKNYLELAAKGKLSATEYISTIGKDLGIADLDAYHEKWLALCEKFFTIDERMMVLLEQLKRQGFLLATLTDVIPPHDIVRQKHNTYQYFSVQLLSYKVGLTKPEKRFYQLLLEQLPCDPEEVIFIDDSKKSLEAAQKLGMQVIHFESANDHRPGELGRGAELLVEKLAEFGIFCMTTSKTGA